MNKEFNYLSLGSIGISTVKMLDASYNYIGEADIAISASMVDKEELEPRDVPKIKFCINSRQMNPEGRTTFTTFRFTYADCYLILKTINAKYQTIKNGGTFPLVINFEDQLSSAGVSVRISSDNTQMLLVDRYNNENRVYFMVLAFEWDLILNNIKYFMDNYINLNTFFINKLTTYIHNKKIESSMLTLQNKYDNMLNFAMQSLDKLNNVPTFFASFLDKIDTLNGNLVNCADKLSMLTNTLSNNNINIPNNINPVDKEIITNNLKPLLETEFAIDSNALENSYDPVNYNIVFEPTIPEPTIPEPAIPEPAMYESAIPNTIEIMDNENENSLSDTFMNFLDDNSDIIKNERIDMLSSEKLDLFENQEVIDKVSHIMEVNKQDSVSAKEDHYPTEPVIPTEYKINNIETFRVKLRNYVHFTKIYDKILVNLCKDLLMLDVITPIVNTPEFKEFSNYMTLVLGYYVKHGLINGYLDTNVPIFHFDVNPESIKNINSSSRKIYTFFAYLWIVFVYSGLLSNKLMSCHLDDANGIKDERQTSGYVRLVLMPIFNSYARTDWFDFDKLELEIVQVLTHLKVDYFSVDKLLSSYAIDTKFLVKNTCQDEYLKVLKTFKKYIQEEKAKSIPWKDTLYNRLQTTFNLNLNTPEKLSDIESLFNALNNNDIDDSDKERVLHTVLNKLLSINVLHQLLLRYPDHYKNNDLYNITAKIVENYEQFRNTEEFTKIQWSELPLDILKGIVVYNPHLDRRYTYDFNFFMQKINSLQLDKSQCLQYIMNSSGKEQIKRKESSLQRNFEDIEQLNKTINPF